MNIEVEVIQIDRAVRPNGDSAFRIIIGQPFVSIAKAREKNPSEATLVISQQGSPKSVSLPFENKLILYLSDDEFAQIREKIVVGKTYFMKFDKGKFSLEF